MYEEHSISELVGKTLIQAFTRNGDEGDEIVFLTDSGEKWVQYHCQDCCESVYVDDIVGDLADLVGSPILTAEVSSNSDNPKLEESDDSHTWTFYKLATIRGSVTIRWYGTSNGYYSESVNLRVEKSE